MNCSECIHFKVCSTTGSNYNFNPEIGCNKFLSSDNLVPRKRGSWRLESDAEMPDPLFKLVVCSVCGKTANDTYPFCPQCGNPMDQGVKSSD